MESLSKVWKILELQFSDLAGSVITFVVTDLGLLSRFHPFWLGFSILRGLQVIASHIIILSWGFQSSIMMQVALSLEAISAAFDITIRLVSPSTKMAFGHSPQSNITQLASKLATGLTKLTLWCWPHGSVVISLRLHVDTQWRNSTASKQTKATFGLI